MKEAYPATRLKLHCQMEALAAYVKTKNQSLYDFLTSVGFTFTDKTSTDRYYYRIDELNGHKLAARDATLLYEKSKELFEAQGILDLPPVQERLNSLLAEAEQHNAEIRKIEAEREVYGQVDLKALATSKTVYMLSGAKVEQEIRYSGFSHSRHAYRNYYINGVNILSEGAGSQKIRLGSTEDGPKLESMGLLIFQ